MAPRITPDSIRAPQLQTTGPGAYPIDPFSRAPESNLSRLANALGDLAPRLAQLSDDQRREDSERGEEKARADFLDMKATGQLIKEGKLEPSGSTWFRRHYHETIGSLTAAQYASDLDAAMRDPDGPLAESTDPEDFDRFTAEFREGWLTDNVGKGNADFTAGFNGTVVGSEMNLRNRFIAEAGARLEGKSIDALYAKQQVLIANARTGEVPMTPQQIADGIKVLNQQQYFLNPRAGRSINKATIEAIFDAARQYEDPELLEVLDYIDSGIPGAVLGKTKDAVSKRDDVEKEIRNNRQDRLADEDRDKKRERQDSIDDLYDKVGAAFDAAEVADTVPTKGFLDAMTKIDPDEAPKLQRVIAAYQKGIAKTDDPQVTETLYARAFDESLTNDAVFNAFVEGKITKETAKDLRTQVRANRSGRSQKALVQDPLFGRFVSLLNRQFILNDGRTNSARQTSAEIQLTREWLAFRRGEGAGLSETEVGDWLQNAVDRNFRRFAAGDDALIERMKETPMPDPAVTGPQPLPWEKAVVIDNTDLAQLANEHERILSGNRNSFSPRALNILAQHKLDSPDAVRKFIEAQRMVRALTPGMSTNPDQIR